MRIPTVSDGHMKLPAIASQRDSTGICPEGMPYDFVSPEIVLIYRLHAGGLQGFFVSTVCGSVWPSKTRTEPVRDPHDDFQNS